MTRLSSKLKTVVWVGFVLTCTSGCQLDEGTANLFEFFSFKGEVVSELYSVIPATTLDYALYGQELSEEGMVLDAYGPSGFAIDKEGIIWIGNASHVYLPNAFKPSIYKFHPDGKHLETFSYPENQYFTDFFTQDGELLAINADPGLSSGQTVRLDSSGHIKEEQQWGEGLDAFEDAYHTIIPGEDGAILVKAFGQGFGIISEEGWVEEGAGIEEAGGRYQIKGTQLFINDLLVDELDLQSLEESGAVGGMVLIGFTHERKGICIAKEILIPDVQLKNTVTTTINCFDSKGHQRASIEIPIEDEVAYNRHYVLGEEGDVVYTMQTKEGFILIHRIQL